MEEILVSTYKLTISVKGNLEDETFTGVRDYCKKLRSFFQVEERGQSGGHRHMHCLLLTDPMNKDKKKEFKRQIFNKFVKDKYPGSISRHAVVMNVQYDHNWVDEYLKKEDGYVIHHDNYKRELVEQNFPSVDEQEHLQQDSKARNANSMWLDLCTDWEQHPEFPNDIPGAMEYFNNRMFVKRDMPVITDDRFRRNKAMSLFMFRRNRYNLAGHDWRWLQNNYDDDTIKVWKKRRTELRQDGTRKT